jgi:hypothetical protein
MYASRTADKLRASVTSQVPSLVITLSPRRAPT